MPLKDLKVSRDELLKRKAREEIMDDYREKRRRIQRKILEAGEKLRSRPDGADLQAERDEEDYWDAIYGDLEEEEFPSSDSDSEKESEEDSMNDDDEDESDDSDD
ncbi:nucleolar transcription factor 1-like [Papaver somniferum]|uniref:nucleolar transcription factor 1-like n=1 Tax=Papaver somniferum TaxID=3469 RepID=UPI000E6F4CCD|nr:nucleolar transcription factor 1-like [Papaver somniferum]